MKKEILDKLHKTQVEILDEIVRICNENELNYFLVGGTLLGAVRHNGFIPWDDDLDIGMTREDYDKFLNIAQKEMKNNYILEYYKTNKKYWLPFSKVRLKNTLYIENTIKNYETNKEIWVDIFPIDNVKEDLSLLSKLQWKLIFFIKKINYIKVVNNTNNILKKVFAKCTIIKINVKLINFCMKLQNKNSNKWFVNFGSQYGIKKQTHLKEKYFPAKELEFEGKKYKVPNDYNYVLTKIYGKNYMELPPIKKRITHNPIRIRFEDGEEVNFSEGEK